MIKARKSLQEIISELPPALQDEVRDFAEFLLERTRKKPGRKLRQDWGGALAHLRDQYTSVELQHKVSDWRIESALKGMRQKAPGEEEKKA